MNTKQITTFAPLLILVSIVGIFLYIPTHKSSPSNSTQSAASSTTSWITYENTKYHYQLSYPENGRVSCEGYEIEPIQECLSLRIGVEGMSGQIAINAEPFAFPNFTSAQRRVLSLNLKSFAEHERTVAIKDDASKSNLSSSNSLVSSTTTIASQVAYGFNNTGRGRIGVGFFSDGEMGISSEMNSYFAIQNKSGDKFIIIFPANNPISQKIVDSFKFTDSSTTASPQY